MSDDLKVKLQRALTDAQQVGATNALLKLQGRVWRMLDGQRDEDYNAALNAVLSQITSMIGQRHDQH